MTIRDLALEGLQQSINGLLALDPRALQRLAALHGRCIAVDLSGIGLRFHFVPGHDGRLQVLGSIEGEPDSLLIGSPLDLMRAGDRSEGHAQLFAGHVRIEGDTRTAQQFSAALADLDIDWEEQLSHLVGDITAHEIGRGLRGAFGEAERIFGSSADNLSEYLTEEARLLPHRFEVEDFLNETDNLRDDVERLEARIALIEKHRAGSPP